MIHKHKKHVLVGLGLFFIVGMAFAASIIYPSNIPSGQIDGGNMKTVINNISSSCGAGNYLQGFNADGSLICKSITSLASATLSSIQNKYTASGDGLFRKYFNNILNDCGNGRYVRGFNSDKKMICSDKTGVETLVGLDLNPLPNPIPSLSYPSSVGTPSYQTYLTNILSNSCGVNQSLFGFDYSGNKLGCRDIPPSCLVRYSFINGDGGRNEITADMSGTTLVIKAKNLDNGQIDDCSINNIGGPITYSYPPYDCSVPSIVVGTVNLTSSSIRINGGAGGPHGAHFDSGIIPFDSFCGVTFNGVCGSAHTTMGSVAPTTNLCNSGTPSAVSGSGPWIWTCNGINGGTSASCSANKLNKITVQGGHGNFYVYLNVDNYREKQFIISGRMHSWDNRDQTTIVKIDSNGNIFSLDGSNISKIGGDYLISGGVQTWGYYQNPYRNCIKAWNPSFNDGASFGDFCKYAINGTCGITNATTVSTVPTTNLCATGTASSVSGTGPWTWTCNGSGGGTSASCSANKLTTYTTDCKTALSLIGINDYRISSAGSVTYSYDGGLHFISMSGCAYQGPCTSQVRQGNVPVKISGNITSRNSCSHFGLCTGSIDMSCGG